MDVEQQIDQEVNRAVEDAWDMSQMYGEQASISAIHGWLSISGSQIGQYNPDDISLSTYKKMLDDEVIASAFDVIRLAVLSTDWNLNYTGNNEHMRDTIVPWLEKQLNNVNQSLGGAKGIRHVIWEMLQGIAYGHIPTEIVLRPANTVDGLIELEKLKPIDPETVRKFDVDSKSNLRGIVQSNINQLGSSVLGSGAGGNYLNKRKILLYVHNMSFQNYWGKSDLRRVYRSWFIKQFVVKFWNIAIEKFALPWTVGITEDKGDAKALLAKIQKLQKTSAVVVDSDKKIDFLKGQVDSSAFIQAVEYHDKRMLTGMLVPPSQIESTSGAFAQSRTQQSTFMLRIRSIQREIEGVMEQLIKLLVDLNFENVRGEYPTFNFEEPSIDDVIQMSNAINAAVSAGYLDVETDFKWIRERLGFPEAEPEAMIGKPEPQNPFAGMFGGPQQMPGPDTTRRGQFKDPEIQDGRLF